MTWNENKSVRIAILDLNDGHANQGMRCIRQIIRQWSEENELNPEVVEFDVRQKNELPDTSFDIFISSGGPGDPLSSRFDDWDIAWNRWLSDMVRWNENPANVQKKRVFLICHSFQLACRHFETAIVTRRRSTSFGVFPVHMLREAYDEPVFDGLRDPFYAVDSRDYQVVQPNHTILRNLGAEILCIEKNRPHVPYERAIMAIRFNEYMIGTQFHPEADAEGMSLHLQKDDRRQVVIENHGEEKLNSMLEQLNDPDKIRWTYAHILPNFLNESVGQLQPGEEVMA
ncbi:MAG: GMP synthase [Sphingobacteriales bacterium SCN 48-20]|uniref:type 1 glutamine amidotransferase n=1 Tax=Terrimonas ferruginea TaxID=249 RepID=UPI00086DEC95|nr:GMP synthase [Terrimonas ferruginea]MBN8784817.1 GMP synthase [Terrimonas ferruginea]ODT94957.1 MAG: GMP synthase [Sphingobacteriales bacterium SCN 48-20]OJW45349.1 MAG: GMP synthase [Sphingobacteriales bacterium 48-107]